MAKRKAASARAQMKASSATLRFLRFAPAYALDEAYQAVETVRQMEESGSLKNGIHYVVLVDLVGSTSFGTGAGNDRLARRIEKFVLATITSISTCGIDSRVFFVKEIGDAVLLLFQHFPDIPRWVRRTRAALRSSREPFQLRVCVHIGEVFLADGNPISVAVSELFKLEKNVGGNDIVLTQARATRHGPR